MTRSFLSINTEQNRWTQRGSFLFNTYIYIYLSKKLHSRYRVITQSYNGTETLQCDSLQLQSIYVLLNHIIGRKQNNTVISIPNNK